MWIAKEKRYRGAANAPWLFWGDQTMTHARNRRGIAVIAGLDGSAEAKCRLQVILETLAGQLTISQAISRLGIGERRFHYLRKQCLRAALSRLEPQPAGRPARARLGPEQQHIAALERAVTDLRIDLRAAQLREEIALAMPHLLQRAPRAKKGTGSRSHR